MVLTPRSWLLLCVVRSHTMSNDSIFVQFAGGTRSTASQPLPVASSGDKEPSKSYMKYAQFLKNLEYSPQMFANPLAIRSPETRPNEAIDLCGDDTTMATQSNETTMTER